MMDICKRFLFCFEKQNIQNYSELNKAPTYEQNVSSDKHSDVLETACCADALKLSCI